MFTAVMDLHDLTPGQLRRAASIKERIAELNRDLTKILGSSANGAGVKNHRTMSASAKRRIAAAQKARWAKFHGAKPTVLPTKAAAKPSKRTMTPAAKKKLSAKLKAYWAAKKSGRK
jgi:hypothetical protein